jgi:hypothetical protein
LQISYGDEKGKTISLRCWEELEAYDKHNNILKTFANIDFNQNLTVEFYPEGIPRIAALGMDISAFTEACCLPLFSFSFFSVSSSSSLAVSSSGFSSAGSLYSLRSDR